MFRLEMAKGSHRTGELADTHLLGRIVEADQVALDLGIPVEQLEAEGSGLGVNSVGTADGGRVLELERSSLEHIGQNENAFAYQQGGILDLQRLRGVNDVVRGEAIVQP